LNTESELLIVNSSDAVLLLTPTPQHYDQIQKSINYFTNIISEKSLVTSFDQSKDLNELIKLKKRNIFTTLNYSGYPMVREIAQRIQESEIGKLYFIEIEMPQETFARNYNIQDWRKQDYEIPCISLDLGVHVFHLLNFLSSEKFSFSNGVYRKIKNIYNVVDNVSCELISLSGSIVAQLSFSKIHLGERNGLKFKVIGELGSYSWTQEIPDHFLKSKPNGEKIVVDRGSKLIHAAQNRYQRFKAGHPTGFVESLANLYKDMYDAIIASQSNSFTSGVDEAVEFAFIFDRSYTTWKELNCLGEPNKN
jgi:predicted dehydrogenase